MLTQDEFEEAVSEALASIPKRFLDLIQNVTIDVEDEPELEAEPGHELLGLYRGVPITQRSAAPLLPDRITIYRGPICRVAHSRDAIVQQIRDTVVHEVGHYFGLSDGEMPPPGRGTDRPPRAL